MIHQYYVQMFATSFLTVFNDAQKGNDSLLYEKKLDRGSETNSRLLLPPRVVQRQTVTIVDRRLCYFYCTTVAGAI